MALPRSGPVRSEAARQAILRATAELLVDGGYDHLTIEGIAARAGVGKQTIYRWWPSRAAVVSEALMEGLLISERLTVPDTGDIRADLTSWLSSLSHVIGDEHGAGLVRSIVTAATHNADIAQHLSERLVPTASLSARLETAIGTVPNLRPGVPVQALADMILGSLVMRILAREPLDENTIDDLVAVVLGR